MNAKFSDKTVSLRVTPAPPQDPRPFKARLESMPRYRSAVVALRWASDRGDRDMTVEALEEISRCIASLSQ